MQDPRTHFGLVAVLVSMGAVYLSGLGMHGMFMWDEAHYAVLGRALADGDGYVAPDGRPEGLRPPLLPAAIAAVLIGHPDATDTTLLHITVAATLLCVAVIYGCVISTGNSIGALAASLLFATFPEIWRSTTYLLTEIPFMLFYTPAVFFFHRGIHTDPRNFTIAWPCFALALMTRYTAVLFGPTCVLLLAVPVLSGDRDAIARMRSPYFLLGPALAALIVAPMLARAWILFGDPLTGFKAAALQLPNYSVHAEMPVWTYLSLLPTMMGGVPAGALLLAAADSLARRDRLAITCLIAATVLVAWLSQYGWKEPRLISAALPFLAIVIGIRASQLWEELGASVPGGAISRGQLAIASAGAILLVGGIRIDPSYTKAQWEISHAITLGYPSFRSAMLEVDTGTPPSTVLMGPNCYQIAWYAHRPCFPLPSDSELRDNGRSLSDHLSGVDYVVATSFERGQPAYVDDEFSRAEREHGDLIETFRDSRFWTKVAPADILRVRSRFVNGGTS